MVMEYLPYTLKTVVEYYSNGTVLPLERVRTIVVDLIDALAQLHFINVAHR